MAKTTYLLGAGASAGSLPTVAEFEKKINELLILFSFYERNPNIKPRITLEGQNIFDAIIMDLKKLLIGCQNHRSVDTYAKMLFLTDQKQEYYNLKCSIILFFELCRFYYKNTDKRYDAFLATILKPGENGNLTLPQNINILSWNYDYEFERAYMKYIPHRNNIHEVCNDLNIIHKDCITNRDINNNFGILKINGTAGFYTTPEEVNLGLDCYDLYSSHTLNIDQLSYEAFIKKCPIGEVFPILKKYYDLKNIRKLKPAISFSWEDGNNMKSILKKISTSLQETTRIIVIVYSFPYFNREVDSEIMSYFKKYQNGKIIIQDYNAAQIAETVEELRTYWGSIHDKTKFITTTNTDQFYMSF